MSRLHRFAGWLAVFFAVAAITTACGGGGGAGPAPAAPGSGSLHAAPVPGVTSIAYASGTLAGATYLGPAQFGSMDLDVVPAMQNAAGLQAYAAEVSDPQSAMFRHFLTPAQIGDQFGASAADYQAEAAYFTSHGLTVDGWPQRMLLHVGGTQAQLESALGAHFGVYALNGQTFVALTSNPVLPASLHIAAMRHASSAPPAWHVPAGAASLQALPLLGPGYYVTPQQLAHAYDYDGAWGAGFTGSGINVGIIGSAGIDPQDVPTYGQIFNAQVATVTQVDAQNAVVFPSAAPTNCASPYQYFTCNYSSGLATAPPVTAPCHGRLPKCNPEDGEAQLDTQTIASLAYGANVLFYLAYNPTECYAQGNYSAPGATCPPGPSPTPSGTTATSPFPELGLDEFDPEIQQAIADDKADVISISIGECEPQAIAGNDFNSQGQGYEPQEFAALKAEGVAVFIASGDDGVADCDPSPAPAADYPGTDPSNVDVGAVFSPLDPSGNLTGQVAAWGYPNTFGNNADCSNCVGSGGGVSAVFSRPANQFGPGLNGAAMRNVPDIAYNGASNSPIALVQYAGLGGPNLEDYHGTSEAAPMASAMWALVLQACKQTPACSTAAGPYPYRLGDPKTYLYAIYNNQPYGSFTPQLGQTYGSVFYDVLYGNNSASIKGQVVPGYNAGPGYDNVTGLGVPFVREMIKAVVGV